MNAPLEPSGWPGLSAKDRLIVLYRLGFAVLTLAAIVTQLLDQIWLMARTSGWRLRVQN